MNTFEPRRAVSCVFGLSLSLSCSSSVTSPVHRADTHSWSGAPLWELLDPSDPAIIWLLMMSLLHHAEAVCAPAPPSELMKRLYMRAAGNHPALTHSLTPPGSFCLVLLFWSSFWRTVGCVPLGLSFLDESVPTAEHRSLSTCSALPQSSLHHSSSSVSKRGFFQPQEEKRQWLC